MIRLEVQPYCSECYDFSPNVTGPEKLLFSDGHVEVSDTVVCCKHSGRCESIKKYLTRQMEKGEQG